MTLTEMVQNLSTADLIGSILMSASLVLLVTVISCSCFYVLGIFGYKTDNEKIISFSKKLGL